MRQRIRADVPRPAVSDSVPGGEDRFLRRLATLSSIPEAQHRRAVVADLGDEVPIRRAALEQIFLTIPSLPTDRLIPDQRETQRPRLPGITFQRPGGRCCGRGAPLVCQGTARELRAIARRYRNPLAD